MKKKFPLPAYILIGLGIYFLLKELKLPILTDFFSWTTLLLLVGSVLLYSGFKTKDQNHLFSGTIILALGIHLHGRAHYAFWIDDWAVYILIVGIAYIIRAFQVKKGLFTGLLLVFVSLIMIFPERLPAPFNRIEEVTAVLDTFWPLLLIVIGFYWLKKK